jgi:hypothetical protein
MARNQSSPTQKTIDATAAGRILAVSQGFFSTLGTRFALGTSWPITGNEQDCLSQAVVSGGYWKRPKDLVYRFRYSGIVVFLLNWVRRSI